MSLRKCFVAVFAVLLALAGPVFAGVYNPSLDFNSDGVIGPEDIFQGSLNWQDPASPFSYEQIQEMLASWGTTGQPGGATPTPRPTDTPLPPGERVLSFPQDFQVVFAAGATQVSIPLSLNDADGLGFIQFRVPTIVQDPGGNYQVLFSGSLTGVRRTALTADFDPPTLAPDITFTHWVVTTEGGMIDQPGGGVLLNLDYFVQALVPGPLPQDIEIPLELSLTILRNGSGQALTHTAENGSLLINPSNADPTATQTPFIFPTTPGPTATPAPPTPTPEPGTVPAELNMVACSDEGIIGDSISLYIDLLDANGRIINPGTPDGVRLNLLPEIMLTVNGSAVFEANGEQALTTTVAESAGLRLFVQDMIAETVTVQASSPGLTSPPPIELTFLPGGKIAGQVMVFDSMLGEVRPARSGEVSIFVIDPADQEEFLLDGEISGVDGMYETKYLPAGSYDVSFTANPTFIGKIIPVMDPLEGVCVEGVSVQNGATTEDIDATLNALTGPRLFGNVTDDNGELLAVANVGISPIFGEICGRAFRFTVAQVGTEGTTSLAYELLNVQSGEYTMTATVQDPTFQKRFSSFEENRVTVGSQDVEQDIVVAQAFDLNPVTPINYARTDGSPTFEWEALDPLMPEMTYEVTVIDRCGRIVWSMQGISGTSVQYGGPPLSTAEIYTWVVIGLENGGNRTAQDFVDFAKLPRFLLD